MGQYALGGIDTWRKKNIRTATVRKRKIAGGYFWKIGTCTTGGSLENNLKYKGKI